jgi:RNA polymerase sigma factor (sigma-70 family)
MTETETLLREYARDGSESAFRELVARYLNFIYSTALRVVGGDSHLAADVTQTVFIHLARNAQRLPADVMLGGWLHRDTCNVASKLMRGERRRQARERQAAEMNALQDHSPDNLSQLTPVLDDAINHLGGEDRTAILLRFFEQLDFRAVAAGLGSTEDAARKRVSRALDKLQNLLKARGVALSTASLVTALTAGAVKAAPAALLPSVVGTALASSALAGGAGVTLLKFMTTSKFGFGVAGAVAVAGAVLAAKEHQLQSSLRDENAALRQKSEQLVGESERISNQLAQAGSASTGANDEQLRELMRLRGEVATLKAQLADAAKAQAREREKRNQEAQVGDPSPEQVANAWTSGRDAKILGYAFRAYASAHGDQSPTSFAQVWPYVGEALRADLNPGDSLRDTSKFFAEVTNQFEIVYRGSLTNTDENTILYRERQPRPDPTRGWVKAYGLASGVGELHAEPDGNFETWEREHTAALAGLPKK